MQRELDKRVGNVAVDATVIFAGFAPKRTRRLVRGIRQRQSGSVAIVTVDAKNPKTGYDYVGVTRFGHRVARIFPKHSPKEGRYIAPLPGVGPRWVKKAAALGPIPGIGFRRSVRGFKPAGDWRDRALPTIQAESEREMAVLGQEFIARVL
jgi:hypothetical protein